LGVDAVINVIQSPALERESSTEFFTTVAANLGRAATDAGVGRTDAVRDGILLPGPDAGLIGPSLDEWLAAR
jgi:hypothetical protein